LKIHNRLSTNGYKISPYVFNTTFLPPLSIRMKKVEGVVLVRGELQKNRGFLEFSV